MILTKKLHNFGKRALLAYGLLLIARDWAHTVNFPFPYNSRSALFVYLHAD